MSISKKAVERDEIIPKVLMERLISLTSLCCCLRFTVKSWYLLVFRAALIDRFVSNPTVSSRIYKQVFLKVKRRSGRKLSPVITDGLIKPGRSAYNVVPVTPCNDDAIK